MAVFCIIFWKFSTAQENTKIPRVFPFTEAYCLSNRKQYVLVNGKDSCYLSVSCGVPQGSILGPLLFLLYINDLSLSSSKLTFYLLADDTNI